MPSSIMSQSSQQNSLPVEFSSIQDSKLRLPIPQKFSQRVGLGLTHSWVFSNQPPYHIQWKWIPRWFYAHLKVECAQQYHTHLGSRPICAYQIQLVICQFFEGVLYTYFLMSGCVTWVDPLLLQPGFLLELNLSQARIPPLSWQVLAIEFMFSVFLLLPIKTHWADQE